MVNVDETLRNRNERTRRSGTLKSFGGILLGVALTLAVAGCGDEQPAPSPTPTPADPGAEPTAPPAFEEAWPALIERAGQEGDLAMAVSSGSLTEYGDIYAVFEKEFGVKVVVSAGRGGDQANRLLAERRNGRYTVDIWGSGPGTTNAEIIPTGALVPLPPLLIHPEVVDESLWRGGQHTYGDPDEQYIFFFVVQASFGSMPINSNLVEKRELSLWELFEPQYKGRVVSLDPRDPSFGMPGDYADILRIPELGEEFLRRFLTELDLIFVRDTRQYVNLLATGEAMLGYPVGPTRQETLRARTAGLPVDVIDRLTERGPTLTGAGRAVASVVERAPNPNAARLFINWWLTRDVQIEVQRGSGYQSMRNDIPREGVLPDNVVPNDLRVELGVLHPEFPQNLARAEEIIDELFGGGGPG